MVSGIYYKEKLFIYIYQEVTKMDESAGLVIVFFILTYKEIYSWLLCI